MKLLDVLSEEKLHAEIADVGAKTIMLRWSATANEVSRTKHHQIGILLAAYSEMDASDLKPYRVTNFLSSLIDLLDTDKERQSLLTAEALHLKK